MILVSALALLAGIVSYGIAGARLHTGSHHESGAVHSRDFWLGTGFQGLGFLLTLVARFSLPLLLVQACASAGLVVTALIQHARGVRRLSARGALIVLATIAGLGLIATGTVPGPAEPIDTALMILLGGCALATAGILALPSAHYLVTSVASGIGFGYGAIGARLLMGDAAHPLWLFWALPWQNWLVGIITASGIVLGQVHLTRALRGHHAAPVLGLMYLAETVFPAAVGVTLMGESIRSGYVIPVVIGLLVAGASLRELIRLSE